MHHALTHKRGMMEERKLQRERERIERATAEAEQLEVQAEAARAAKSGLSEDGSVVAELDDTTGEELGGIDGSESESREVGPASGRPAASVDGADSSGIVEQEGANEGGGDVVGAAGASEESLAVNSVPEVDSDQTEAGETR